MRPINKSAGAQAGREISPATARFTDPDPPACQGGFAMSCFGLAAPYHDRFQADFNQHCTLDQEDLNGYVALFTLDVR